MNEGRVEAPRVRVASVPAGHPYVRAVCDPAHVQLLADPVPPGAAAGQWWPPQVLDPDWIRAHAARFDVLHVHFGTETLPVGRLERALRAARAVGRPVVHTVHDLSNPQLRDQRPHRRVLDVLVPAADHVLTLTQGAAREIERTWGRTAAVVAHPSLTPPDAGAPPTGRAGGPPRVGVHLRDLRPSIDAVAVVRALTDAVTRLRSDGLVVHAVVHVGARVREESVAQAVGALVAGVPGVDLHRAPRLDDAALAEALADLDVLLLPYAHGTHSGWVELCYDLGVPVIGPRHGYWGEQHPEDYTPADVTDPVALADAVTRVTGASASRPGSAGRRALVRRRLAPRRAQARAVREAHTAVYRTLVAAGAAA